MNVCLWCTIKHMPREPKHFDVFGGCNIHTYVHNVSSILEGDKGSDCWFSINIFHAIQLDCEVSLVRETLQTLLGNGSNHKEIVWRQQQNEDTQIHEHKHQIEQPIQKLCKRISFYEVTRFRLFRVRFIVALYTHCVFACVSVYRLFIWTILLGKQWIYTMLRYTLKSMHTVCHTHTYEHTQGK